MVHEELVPETYPMHNLPKSYQDVENLMTRTLQFTNQQQA